MDAQKLRKILLKSYTMIFVITAILLAGGAGMIVAAFIREQGSMIAMLIFGLIFFGLGAVVVIRKLGSFIAVFSGSLPILKAIKEKDESFLVWIYREQINTTAGHNGTTLGTANNIVYFDRNGNNDTLVLSKISPDEIISYLVSVFPNAKVGYNEETKAEVARMLGKKI